MCVLQYVACAATRITLRFDRYTFTFFFTKNTIIIIMMRMWCFAVHTFTEQQVELAMYCNTRAATHTHTATRILKSNRLQHQRCTATRTHCNTHPTCCSISVRAGPLSEDLKFTSCSEHVLQSVCCSVCVLQYIAGVAACCSVSVCVAVCVCCSICVAVRCLFHLVLCKCVHSNTHTC